MIQRMCLAILYLAVCLSRAAAQPAPAAAEQLLNRRLEALRDSFSVVGMSAAVVRGDSILTVRTLGWADLDRRIPVTAATMFRIASITKTVTATAVLQCAERGLLKLEDDCSVYLGCVVRNPRHPDVPLTIRQLLTHTSSLTDGGLYDSLLMLARRDPPPALKEILSPGGTLYRPELWAAYAPGDTFEYCNLAYAMLGTIVEKASGERFDRYCRDHIYRPLGMESTQNVQDIADINRLGVLYRKEDTVWRPQTDNFRGVKPLPRDFSGLAPGTNALPFSPQGGMRTSAEDMAKFLIAHMNNGVYRGARILNDSTAAAMHSVQWQGAGLGGFYKQKGFGFHITDDLIPGYRLVGHTGDAYGLLSLMYFSSQTRSGFVIMFNGCDQRGDDGFHDVEKAAAQAAWEYLQAGTVH